MDFRKVEVMKDKQALFLAILKRSSDKKKRKFGRENGKALRKELDKIEEEEKRDSQISFWLW